MQEILFFSHLLERVQDSSDLEAIVSEPELPEQENSQPGSLNSEVESNVGTAGSPLRSTREEMENFSLEESCSEDSPACQCENVGETRPCSSDEQKSRFSWGGKKFLYLEILFLNFLKRSPSLLVMQKFVFLSKSAWPLFSD